MIEEMKKRKMRKIDKGKNERIETFEKKFECMK